MKIFQSCLLDFITNIHSNNEVEKNKKIKAIFTNYSCLMKSQQMIILFLQMIHFMNCNQSFNKITGLRIVVLSQSFVFMKRISFFMKFWYGFKSVPINIKGRIIYLYLFDKMKCYIKYINPQYKLFHATKKNNIYILKFYKMPTKFPLKFMLVQYQHLFILQGYLRFITAKLKI